jgi:transposase
MSAPSKPLPNDVPSLQSLATSLQAQLLEAQAKVRLQEEMIRLMRIEKYGPKSEKLNDAQLELLYLEPGVHAAEIEEEASQTITYQRKARNPKPGRQELAEHLERVEEIIACAPEQCRCGRCGQETGVIGYDSSEQLEVEPAKYYVRVIKREKRACQSCPDQGVSSARVPLSILDKSKLSDRLIIQIVLAKYRDHLPLYRQSAMFLADAQVDISRSTLCHQVMHVGSLCAAIAREMTKDLLAGGYIQADEMPVGVQSAKVKGRNHRGWIWEYSRPHGPVIFDFQMSRSREGPQAFLKDYRGLLQCDGYGAYNNLGNDRIERLGCMAHLRRKFHEAHKVAKDDPLPREILDRIKGLYQIESEAREGQLNDAQRHELRQRRSAPIMKELKARILEIRQTVAPASAMGKACDYALAQWDRAEKYLNHGQAEIDNNWAENAIRPIAIGRKNWLHIGSEEAGEKIAGILSIVETCRRLEINVRDYMLDVLPGLAERDQSQLRTLTPMAWRKRQAPA